MELTEFGALVVNVIGYACVGFVAILMLIMIGTVLWMIAHMCGELGKTDLSRPICTLTWERCIYTDDTEDICKKCRIYQEYENERKRANESVRQNGPQRGRISGSNRRRRSQEHAERKTAKRRTASGSH